MPLTAPGQPSFVWILKLEGSLPPSYWEGFCEAFSYYCDGGQVVEVVEGHLNDEETFQKCLNLFEKYPSLAGLYVNVSICQPVCYALRARGLAGKVRVVVTDLFQE